MIINFQNYKCQVRFSRYSLNRQPAIYLIGAPGTEYAGRRIAVATACIDSLTDGVTTAVNDYGANAGVFNVLKANGLIVDTGKTILDRFIELPLVTLAESIQINLPEVA